MSITANQLTVSRIVLMPLPVALLLSGDRTLQIVAWALYIVLGVTDYFDGVLARKHGFTRFGRLTDPIADKIYVALMFLPLALLGHMPEWAAVLVLMRDPVITALRSMSERYGTTMQTSTLAKYKTAIQMISGGYVMWVGIVPERKVTLAAMSSMALMAWFACVLKRRMRRRWDPRLVTMGGLMTFGLAVRWLLDVRLTLIVYSAIILVVTWLSAFSYLAGFLGGVRRSTRKIGARWWLLYSAESMAVPLFILSLTFLEHVPAWLPMAIFCTELAVGALENMLTQEGESRTARHLAIKLSLQGLLAAATASVVLAPSMGPFPPATALPVLVSAFGLVTLATSVVAFARYAPRIL